MARTIYPDYLLLWFVGFFFIKLWLIFPQKVMFLALICNLPGASKHSKYTESRGLARQFVSDLHDSWHLLLVSASTNGAGIGK